MQFTASGVVQGSVFALLALGWVVVMRVSGLLFLLQGEFVVLSALLTVHAHESGLPLPLAMFTAVVASVGLVLAIDFVVIRPLRNATHVSEIVAILGIAIVMSDVLRRVFGPEQRLLPQFLPRESISIFGAFLTPHQLLILAATAVLVVGLFLLMMHTRLGRTMRAAAENQVGALLVGISPGAVRSIGFVIAALLGALAGILLVPVTAVGPTVGLTLGVKGFIAAVFGRWTFPGAVVAGLVLALAESYTVGYVSSAYKDVTALSLLIIVLLVQQFGRRGGFAIFATS